MARCANLLKDLLSTPNSRVFEAKMEKQKKVQETDHITATIQTTSHASLRAVVKYFLVQHK